MTASQSLNPVFSAITMAFLKDTGWYDVDYNFADKFFYGKDEGCDFLTKACFDGRGEPNFQQFCNPETDPGVEGCSEDYLGIGSC